MLPDINKALCGLPSDMIPALNGRGNPYAVDPASLRLRAERPGRIGAAISCAISACKRGLGRNT